MPLSCVILSCHAFSCFACLFLSHPVLSHLVLFFLCPIFSCMVSKVQRHRVGVRFRGRQRLAPLLPPLRSPCSRWTAWRQGPATRWPPNCRFLIIYLIVVCSFVHSTRLTSFFRYPHIYPSPTLPSETASIIRDAITFSSRLLRSRNSRDDGSKSVWYGSIQVTPLSLTQIYYISPLYVLIPPLLLSPPTPPPPTTTTTTTTTTIQSQQPARASHPLSLRTARGPGYHRNHGTINRIESPTLLV